jgi:hypothetical protein
MIRGQSLAQLLAAFDEGLRTIAIQHLDLAAEDTARSDAGDLADSIRRDGMHCLNAWVAELPPCCRDRVVLKFAPESGIGDSISPAHRTRGMLIVNRLLAESVPAPPGEERP